MAEFIASRNRIEDYNCRPYGRVPKPPEGLLEYVDIRDTGEGTLLTVDGKTKPIPPNYYAHLFTNDEQTIVLATKQAVSGGLTFGDLRSILNFISGTLPADEFDVFVIDGRIVLSFWWD